MEVNIYKDLVRIYQSYVTKEKQGIEMSEIITRLVSFGFKSVEIDPGKDIISPSDLEKMIKNMVDHQDLHTICNGYHNLCVRDLETYCERFAAQYVADKIVDSVCDTRSALSSLNPASAVA